MATAVETPTGKAGAPASEREARDVAEAARETEWAHPSFVRELFLGRYRLDLIHPHPRPDPEAMARAAAVSGEAASAGRADRFGRDRPYGPDPGRDRGRAPRDGGVRHQDPAESTAALGCRRSPTCARWSW